MHLLERPLRRLAGSRLVAAATWPHGIDGYAGVLAPAWSVEAVKARVVAVRRQTADTVTLTLRPNGNWDGHRPGQHIVLTVPVDGVRRSRCFSVASSAHDPSVIELTCKAGPDSVVSRHLRDRVEVGDVIDLTPAKGDFVLPEARPASLVLVSAGSGITPVLSMLRTLTDEGHDGTVTFLHYARSADDVLDGDELRTIEAQHPGIRVVLVTEHGSPHERIPSDHHGRFDPSHLPAAEAAFVCGPGPFMDAVETAWLAAGGAADQFHTERFAPPARPASGEAGGVLRFGRASIEVANDGRPVLLQAEAAGLTPAHGCRMGICHTCVVPATAGCLRNADTGEEHESDGSPVRICVSVPVGDLDIDL